MIGGQDELGEPRGRVTRGGLTAPPAPEHLLLVALPLAPRLRAVEGGRHLRGEHNGQRAARRERGAERARVEVILPRIQPTLVLAGQVEALVPGVGGFGRSAFGQDHERPCALERQDAEPVCDGGHHHPPAVRAGERVSVTVVHERVERERRGRSSTKQAVPHIGRVCALLHPHALLEERVAHRIRPDGRGALEREALQRSEALRRDRTVGPAVRAERRREAIVGDRLVELGGQQRAADRRAQGGDEEAVVAPRERSRHGTRGEAAEAVGAEPLAALGQIKLACDFPPEADHAWRLAASLGCAPRREGFAGISRHAVPVATI